MAGSSNREAWNKIAAAYQARYQLHSDRLEWGVWCPDESELGLLGDVQGKRCLVLGCGGGQDCIALARMGAAAITGIDLSDEQIAYARRLLAEYGVQARLIQGTAEDLSPVASESIDIAVSVQALSYVEHIESCFAETYRVLRAGGSFTFSVTHPLNSITSDEPPYTFLEPYFLHKVEWQWDFSEAAIIATFHQWLRPVSEWFQKLADAGFAIERILEPPPVDREPRNGFERLRSIDKARVIPQTLIFAARKPGG